MLRWQDLEESARAREAAVLLEDHRGALLQQSIAFAKRVGAPTIVIFGIVRSPGERDMPPIVRTLLADAAREAERAGVMLALENEHICWADGGERTAALFREIDSPALRINWDPGNAFSAGEIPFPDGYEAVRGLVGHVHVKDARRTGPHAIEWAIEGEIDWPGQLRALAKDGYAVLTHRYAQPGHYVVRAERTDRWGLQAEDTVPVDYCSFRSFPMKSSVNYIHLLFACKTYEIYSIS